MIVQGYNKSLDSKINHKNISRLICKYESEKNKDELYNSFKLTNSSDTFKKIGKTSNDFYQNISSKKTRATSIIRFRNWDQKFQKRTAHEWHQKSHIIKKYFKPCYILSFLFYILLFQRKWNYVSVLACSHITRGI